MEFIPTKWTFLRKNMLPILSVKGESENCMAESLLLGMAVAFIQFGEKYEGKPYQDVPKEKQTARISVDFSLIFPSEEKINKFQEILKYFSQ